VEFVRDAGGAAAVVQQPQAAADFSVAVSSSAVSIWQGGVSAPVSFSIIPHNGFSANVQVRFAGLPAGVTSIPASPFTTASGVDTVVNFGASATTPTGRVKLSHSVSLTVAIQASTVAALPRTNFVRTHQRRTILPAKRIIATSSTMRGRRSPSRT